MVTLIIHNYQLRISMSSLACQHSVICFDKVNGFPNTLVSLIYGGKICKSFNFSFLQTIHINSHGESKMRCMNPINAENVLWSCLLAGTWNPPFFLFDQSCLCVKGEYWRKRFFNLKSKNQPPLYCNIECNMFN